MAKAIIIGQRVLQTEGILIGKGSNKIVSGEQETVYVDI